MQPTSQAVHVNAPLSDVSITYRNQKYVAEDFLRPKLVEKISDKIFQYTVSNMLQQQNTTRALGTRGPEGQWTLSLLTYNCQPKSWTEVIPDETRSNADAPLQLDIDATEIATSVIQLDLENAAAATFTSTANYAASLSQDLTASGNLPWSDPNSDPVGDIEAAKALVLEACGTEPNVGLAGHKVKIALKNHPKIIQRVNYMGSGKPSEGGVVTDQMLAELFDLDEVIDAKAVQNTGAESNTPTLTYIWGNNFVLAVRPPAIGIKTLALGAIMRLRGYRLTEQWHQQPEKLTFIRVLDFYDVFPISNLAGFLFTNAIRAGA